MGGVCSFGLCRVGVCLLCCAAESCSPVRGVGIGTSFWFDVGRHPPARALPHTQLARSGGQPRGTRNEERGESSKHKKEDRKTWTFVERLGTPLRLLAYAPEQN